MMWYTEKSKKYYFESKRKDTLRMVGYLDCQVVFSSCLNMASYYDVHYVRAQGVLSDHQINHV